MSDTLTRAEAKGGPKPDEATLDGWISRAKTGCETVRYDFHPLFETL